MCKRKSLRGKENTGKNGVEVLEKPEWTFPLINSPSDGRIVIVFVSSHMGFVRIAWQEPGSQGQLTMQPWAGCWLLAAQSQARANTGLL